MDVLLTTASKVFPMDALLTTTPLSSAMETLLTTIPLQSTIDTMLVVLRFAVSISNIVMIVMMMYFSSDLSWRHKQDRPSIIGFTWMMVTVALSTWLIWV